mgnify:CR=1 FL=1
MITSLTVFCYKNEYLFESEQCSCGYNGRNWSFLVVFTFTYWYDSPKTTMKTSVWLPPIFIGRKIVRKNPLSVWEICSQDGRGLFAGYILCAQGKQCFQFQAGTLQLMVWCLCKIDVCTWNVRLHFFTLPVSIQIRIFYFSLKHQLPLQTRYTAHCLILYNIANFQPCSLPPNQAVLSNFWTTNLKQLGFLSSHMLHSSLPRSFLSHSSFI